MPKRKHVVWRCSRRNLGNLRSVPSPVHFPCRAFFSSNWIQPEFSCSIQMCNGRLAVLPTPTPRTAPASVSARPGVLGPRRVLRVACKAKEAGQVFVQHRERGCPMLEAHAFTGTRRGMHSPEAGWSSCGACAGACCSSAPVKRL